MTVCALCGDVASIGRVVAVDGSAATVEAEGCRLQVDVELVAPIAVGDLVLCHAGVALQRVDER